MIADDDSGNRQAISELEHEFTEIGLFTAAQSFIWTNPDGGSGNGNDSGNAWDFEDNFSADELAEAVNRWVGKSDLTGEQLEAAFSTRPTAETKTFSIVNCVSFDVYKSRPSKKELNQELSKIARGKILEEITPRGSLKSHYQFEDALREAANFVTE